MPADVSKLKAKVLEMHARGATIEQCMDAVHRHTRTWDYWRKVDPEFVAGIAHARAIRDTGRLSGPKREMPPFDEFCEKYLRQPLHPHQLQWLDLLEGRDPRDLHPAMTYSPGEPEKLLINTPVEHCATVDTPVLTTNGWTTIGEVTDDDFLYDPLGNAHPVLQTWEPDHEVPTFDVQFNTGDVIRTDAGHKWIVQRSANHRPVLMSTAELAADLKCPNGRLKWRVRQAQPVDTKDVDLPIDPYVFGYWLGDGETHGSRFAVARDDRANLEQALADAGFPVSSVTDRDTWLTLYPRGLRSALRTLGVMDAKRIPAEYMLASIPQRRALLQGLMDADGTISAKDGQAYFCQDERRVELNQQVYRLVASLGYQPRMCSRNGMTRIAFKPDAEPVFRLERKASRQFTRTKHRRTDFRTIKSITPAGLGPVKCITVLSDSNEYLIGDALIPTRNAKSTTLTINYVIYRICSEPDVRILIVSKTQVMAKKFLFAIKNKLTHPAFRELQLAFAPEGGWRATADSWTADMIYVGSDDRTSGEKDPTVQALGIRGHIYGARADLIIIDDGVALDNAHEYEKQIEWLEAEVETRLSASGVLMVVGTRIAPLDLYGELENPDRYVDGESPWTRLVQPAVLEFAEDPARWKTLWPGSQLPCQCRALCNKGEVAAGPDGRYPKWDGPHLAKIRRSKSPRTWSLVYMQQQIIEDAVFSAPAVRHAIDGQRMPGPMRVGSVGHRQAGMEGLYVVAGLDPAMAENTAAVVMGVDRTTKRRWVLDVFDRRNVTPSAMRDLIKEWTIRYGIHEWRIEKNAFQIMLTQDAEVRDFLASRGCLLREHFTGNNKWSADFGVASMAFMFGQVSKITTDKGGHAERVEGGLIGLPSTKESEACKRLVEQLITWAPETKNKTDIVMALWFAEIRAREIANYTSTSNHIKNKYLGRRSRGMRAVINLDQAFQEQQEGVNV